MPFAKAEYRSHIRIKPKNAFADFGINEDCRIQMIQELVMDDFSPDVRDDPPDDRTVEYIESAVRLQRKPANSFPCFMFLISSVFY